MPAQELYKIGYTSVLRPVLNSVEAAVKNAFVFKTGMTIDADGSPRAYHPDGAPPGLDHLGNAGKPGNWWALVTDSGQNSGTPLLQDANDPAPGFYISKTALIDRRGKLGKPSRYVDSEEIPFIVLPGGKSRRAADGAKLGDFAAVCNIAKQKLAFGIFADVGPRDHIGEASIAMANAVGVPSSATAGGTHAGILYIVFPGSGNGKPRPADEIDARASALLQAWGGIVRAAALFP